MNLRKNDKSSKLRSIDKDWKQEKGVLAMPCTNLDLLNNDLSVWLPPSDISIDIKKVKSVRDQSLECLQTSKTLARTKIKRIQCDVCKTGLYDGEHRYIVLWELCLVPVHPNCYGKNLLNFDLERFAMKKGYHAKTNGKIQSDKHVITRGWKWERCQCAIEFKTDVDTIWCKFWLK